ncbi:hypothetical protein ASZ90_018548 [hydrocarbon metagenome]|uniref:Uncharacterized protein n=1 Tax=hydrocarbon metagenome TaxID=938273 RepID=A0A0W8E6J5_9ZZZZ
MTELLTQPELKQAVIRTAGNIVKLGLFASASIFATTVFRTQATCTIKGAQMDYFTIRDLFQGH